MFKDISFENKQFLKMLANFHYNISTNMFFILMFSLININFIGICTVFRQTGGIYF